MRRIAIVETKLRPHVNRTPVQKPHNAQLQTINTPEHSMANAVVQALNDGIAPPLDKIKNCGCLCCRQSTLAARTWNSPAARRQHTTKHRCPFYHETTAPAYALIFASLYDTGHYGTACTATERIYTCGVKRIHRKIKAHRCVGSYGPSGGAVIHACAKTCSGRSLSSALYAIIRRNKSAAWSTRCRRDAQDGRRQKQ